MFAHLDDPGTAHGVGIAFSDRRGGHTPGVRGSLNLGSPDVDPFVHRNLAEVGRALSLDALVLLTQRHGTDVLVVTEDVLAAGARPGEPRDWPVADAVVLSRALLPDRAGTRVGVGVRVADCLPVLFRDDAGSTLGAAHAGREGLLAGVLPATVAELRRLGAGALSAVIGPHVCGSCYEVPAPLAAAASERLPELAARTSWGTPALDLAAGARAQLARLGVPSRVVGGCTRTDPRLHSHRRDGAESGRLGGFAWLRL